MPHAFSRLSALLTCLLLSLVANAKLPSTDLVLTAEEAQWLNEYPTVKFTGDPNWLPYEAFDSDGNYIGIVAEHLELIAEITGLKFQMSPSKTWTESTEKAKRGLVDILSETDDSDLKSHLNFTAPYVSNPIVIAMYNTENYVESINAIKDRKVALIKDYGYTSKIRRKYDYLHFITVDNIQDGLISVSTGEVDALLCTLALCSYTIAELGLNNVRIVGKTEFDTKLALGVQKDLPELLSILNKAIKLINREQQQAILDGWIKDKFVEKINYTLVYQVAAIAVFLLAIFAFWNRRLSREINLRIVIEDALKDSEALLENAQRLAQIGHWKLIPSTGEITGSDELFRIFGLSAKDATLKIFVGVVHPDDKVMHAAAMQGGIDHGENWDIKHRLVCRNGVEKWVHAIGEAVLDKNNNVVALVGTVQDISTQKQVEIELAQHRENLEDLVGERTVALVEARDGSERANMAKSEFLSQMSHELRTPLNAILGFGQLLEMDFDELNESHQEYIKEILDAGYLLLDLITDLLDLASIESGRMDISLEDVSIDGVVQQSITLIQNQADACQVDIINHISNTGYKVQASRTRLKQVLLNILSNAVKYNSEPGSITLTSEIMDNQRLRISITDIGDGLTEKESSQLFTSFVRLKTTTNVEGTGIGLVITKHLVELMGGTIGIKSTKGKGSTFWVEFALVKKG